MSVCTASPIAEWTVKITLERNVYNKDSLYRTLSLQSPVSF